MENGSVSCNAMSFAPLTLHLVEGAVSFRITPAGVRDLKAALDSLMSTLKAGALQGTPPAGRPPAKPVMEFCYTGEVFLEVFCNPNIWPSPFAAKLLLTLRDERIRLTTEAELTQVMEDVNQYLEQSIA